MFGGSPFPMPREANEQNLPDRFGHVYKQSVYLKKWNKRLFAIKGGALCYYKDVPEGAMDVDWNQMPDGSILVNGEVKLTDYEKPDRHKRHVLTVSDRREGGSTWHLAFVTDEEKKEWRHHIERLAHTYLKAREEALEKNKRRYGQRAPRQPGSLGSTQSAPPLGLSSGAGPTGSLGQRGPAASVGQREPVPPPGPPPRSVTEESSPRESPLLGEHSEEEEDEDDIAAKAARQRLQRVQQAQAAKLAAKKGDSSALSSSSSPAAAAAAAAPPPPTRSTVVSLQAEALRREASPVTTTASSFVSPNRPEQQQDGSGAGAAHTTVAAEPSSQAAEAQSSAPATSSMVVMAEPDEDGVSHERMHACATYIQSLWKGFKERRSMEGMMTARRSGMKIDAASIIGSAATAALSDSTRTKSLDDLMYDVFNAI